MLGLIFLVVVCIFGVITLVSGLRLYFHKPSVQEVTPSQEETNPNLMVNAPVMFDDFVGQDNAVTLLKVHSIAAQENHEVLPHILIEGPAGTGKTTLAMCMANELDTRLFVTTPSTFKNKDALVKFLFDSNGSCNINEGDIIFIDEVHRMREAAAIYLYSAMQDFYIDVNGTPVDLPEFTVIGATTEAGMLPGPFRDRFKIRVRLARYSVPELVKILSYYRSIPAEVAKEIAKRSVGVPRIAKAITDSVVAVATANKHEIPTIEDVHQACLLLGINEDGLSEYAIEIIKYFRANGNKPTGITTLASTLGISKDTIISELYPQLANAGLLESRGTRGRCLTKAGMEYTL